MAANELGYDAVNDQSEVFESTEFAEQLNSSLGQMLEAAKERGATRVRRRDIESVEYVTPESGGQGYEGYDPIERRVRVNQPELEVSEWRTFVDREAGTAYHWSVSRPVEDSSASPMLTLETPVDTAPWGMDAMKVASVGATLLKRRIQDYVVGDDGKLHGRSADYTILAGTNTYRVVEDSQNTWEATEKEVAFIRDNLGQAELVGGEAEAVAVSDVAPDFPAA